MAYSLKNIAILSAKGATFRCVLMGISKNEGLRRLNNSVTYKWVLEKKNFFSGVYKNEWDHCFNLL